MNTNKIDAPFSELVVPYFKTHSNNEYLDINCGDKAQLHAEWDAAYHIKHGDKPSLYLPHLHDFQLYWWPVADLTILLRWWYKDTKRQIDFANYLVNICRAKKVCTLLSGDFVKFQHTMRLAA